MTKSDACIGVLTSGGDAPGMNAAIRAIVKGCDDRAATVMGIRHGALGLLRDATTRRQAHPRSAHSNMEVRRVRPRTPLLVGFVFGGLFGFAYLVAPLTLFPGLLVWAWLLRRCPRMPAIAGGLIGFGAIWLILLGRMSWACATDQTCVQPNILPLWLGIGAAFLATGLLLALAARSRLFEG